MPSYSPLDPVQLAESLYPPWLNKDPLSLDLTLLLPSYPAEKHVKSKVNGRAEISAAVVLQKETPFLQSLPLFFNTLQMKG
jgi:hypothetical protein